MDLGFIGFTKVLEGLIMSGYTSSSNTILYDPGPLIGSGSNSSQKTMVDHQ